MLDQSVGIDGDCFGEQILGPLGSVAAQVTLADFGPYDLTGTGCAEAFGRSLMSFQFVFSTTLFTWHDQTPLRKSNGCKVPSRWLINQKQIIPENCRCQRLFADSLLGFGRIPQTPNSFLA